jgi:hypothetical protein
VDSKILNFEDAMRLAQIVTKYLDTESINEMTGEEFAYKIFDLLDGDEMIEIEHLLLGDNINLQPKEIIRLCIENMIKNNLFDLLQSYKQLGFGK